MHMEVELDEQGRPTSLKLDWSGLGSTVVAEYRGIVEGAVAAGVTAGVNAAKHIP